MPDVAATATEYMKHDWLTLSHRVAQCKRCSVFMQEDDDYNTVWVEQDGVELANEPHCVERA